MNSKSGDVRVLREESHMWPTSANTYLFEDTDGAILLDVGCGSPGRYQKLKRFLSSSGFTPTDVHTVLLSHAHPDHMGAMPFMLEEAGPRILIHPLEKPLAGEPSLLNRTFDLDYITSYYGDRSGDPGTAQVDIIEYFRNLCPMGKAEASDTVSEGDLLRLGNREFLVIHTPGHAPGHIALYNAGEGILFPGDMLGAVVAWYCPSGGGAAGYLESLDKMESLEAGLARPSHGDDIHDVGLRIEETRKVIVAREDQIVGELSRGPASLLEITGLIFPNKTIHMFPGIQITASHLIKLEMEERVIRHEPEGIPVYELRTYT